MAVGPFQIGTEERYRRSRQFRRPQHDGQPLDIRWSARGHDPRHPSRRPGRRAIRHTVEPDRRLIVVDPDGLDRHAGGVQTRLNAALRIARSQTRWACSDGLWR